MVVLAVNQRSESVSRVTLNSLPDVEYRAAGRVDHHAADLSKSLEVLDGDPESRQDYHILGFHPTEIDLPASRLPHPRLLRHEERDSHRPEFRVHVRVMDDLAGKVDGTIRKLLPRLVRIVDRPLDPITEAELLR